MIQIVYHKQFLFIWVDSMIFNSPISCFSLFQYTPAILLSIDCIILAVLLSSNSKSLCNPVACISIQHYDIVYECPLFYNFTEKKISSKMNFWNNKLLFIANVVQLIYWASMIRHERSHPAEFVPPYYSFSETIPRNYVISATHRDFQATDSFFPFTI
jgi:hypothetical protein